VKKILGKWRKICFQDNIEHLNIPRVMLFGWGILLLGVHTCAVFWSFSLLLQISGPLWVMIILLYRQYYLIWKRYYSLIWPILAQVLSIVVAIYIKVKARSL